MKARFAMILALLMLMALPLKGTAAPEEDCPRCGMAEFLFRYVSKS